MNGLLFLALVHTGDRADSDSQTWQAPSVEEAEPSCHHSTAVLGGSDSPQDWDRRDEATREDPDKSVASHLLCLSPKLNFQEVYRGHDGIYFVKRLLK